MPTSASPFPLPPFHLVLPWIYARLTISLQGPTLLTSLLRSSRRTRSSPRTSSSAVSVFIEVKTTRYRESNVFDLSYFEWEFMSHEPPVRYHIYHVTGAGDPAGARITIIEDPVQAMKDESSRLCMAIGCNLLESQVRGGCVLRETRLKRSR